MHWRLFDRPELKSRGTQGVLRRHSVCILDIEYIGKESNYLLETDVEEGDSSQLEDLSAIPIFRTKFNPHILRNVQSRRIGQHSRAMQNNEARAIEYPKRDKRARRT